MNSDDAASSIFGSAILSSETSAVQIDLMARRLRANGSASWATDYDALAAEHAANARQDRDRADAHAARLDAIRAPF